MEWTEEDEQKRSECEAIIDEFGPTFLRVGFAILTIDEKYLWRKTHDTRDAYFRERFPDLMQKSERHFQHLKAGAKVVQNIAALAAPETPLPETERQVRPLASLDAPTQSALWEKSVGKANGKRPSGAVVAEVVKDYRREERKEDGGSTFRHLPEYKPNRVVRRNAYPIDLWRDEEAQMLYFTIVVPPYREGVPERKHNTGISYDQLAQAGFPRGDIPILPEMEEPDPFE